MSAHLDRLAFRLAIAFALAMPVVAARAQPAGDPVATSTPRFGLAPEAYAAFQRWMLASCIGGEEKARADDLRRYPHEMIVAFVAAVSEGPSDDELAAVRAAALSRYDVRAKFDIREYKIVGVKEADLARFNRVSREQYVDDQLRRFTAGYRSNAIAGLGVIGGAEAKAALARLAANRRDPQADAIRAAQKAMDRR